MQFILKASLNNFLLMNDNKLGMIQCKQISIPLLFFGLAGHTLIAAVKRWRMITGAAALRGGCKD